MISNCDPRIATWDEDGESFTIFNKEMLAQKEIPKFFRHSNYSSFARGLNSYMFRRESMANENNGISHRYSHPNFLRGKPEILQLIVPRRNRHSSTRPITDIVNQLKAANAQWEAYHYGVVDSLKHQIEQLSDDLSSLQDSVHHLELENESLRKRVDTSNKFDWKEILNDEKLDYVENT